MNKDDLQRFAVTMAYLGEAYDKEVSALKMQVYKESLASFGIEQIEAAARDHVRTSEWFPRPSDLIQKMQGDTASIAMMACGVAMDAKNSWSETQFEDPLIHHTIRLMGGWRTFCYEDERFLARQRADFERTYARLSQMSTAALASLGEVPRLSTEVMGSVKRIACNYLGTTPKALPAPAKDHSRDVLAKLKAGAKKGEAPGV